MKYRNKETGAVIEVKSELSGCWEPVKEEKPKGKKPAADPKTKEKEQ